MGRCSRWPIVAGAALAWIAAGAAGAQATPCDIPGALEVRSLDFRGNHAFRSDVLAGVVGTTPSSWVRRRLRVFGTRQCLDRVQLRRDVVLLRVFYRKHGYYDTRVDTTVTPRGLHAVGVRFAIDEGAPVRLDTIRVLWRGAATDSAHVMRGIDLRPGQPADRFVLQADVDTIVARLRDDGYPRADVAVSDTVVDRLLHRARFDLQVVPGTRARIGAVRVRATAADPAKPQQIPGGAVQRVSGLRPGHLYSETDLLNAQRNLYSTDAYRHVGVRVLPDSAGRDSLVDIELSVLEGDMYTARLGVGWATLDCLRATAELTDRNFLSEARRLDLTARVSKLGIGYPLDGAPQLCTRAARQPFTQDKIESDTLNYYGAASFRQPALFGTRTQPSVTIYSERRSEYEAYFRTTPIAAIASLVREQRPRLPVTLSYQLEYGRTNASPALFCAVFRICDSPTRAQIYDYHRLAIAGLSVARDATDDPANPQRGSVVRLDFRHASTAIGSDTTGRFNKVLGDASVYRSIGGGNVVAVRLRLGTVLPSPLSLRGSNAYIPPQERLYAGGSNSVRGYRQNELGPVVYTVAAYDVVVVGSDTFYRARPTPTAADQPLVVPTGGNTLAVGNVELRLHSLILPELLQWTVFADAGELFNRGSETLRFNEVKWTPGAALRVLTRLGPIGVYAAYNSYAKPVGPAYYFERSSQGKVLCVSPDNTIPVVGGTQPKDAVCPSTYSMPRSAGFFQRLTFDFSIGQAF